jgi:hypothetical protein
MMEDLDSLEHMIPEWWKYKAQVIDKSEKVNTKIARAVIFHDYVYEMADNNELNSYLVYEKLFGEDKFIKKLIMATDHNSFELKNLIMGKNGCQDKILELPMVDVFSVLVHDADLYSMTDIDRYIWQAKNVYQEYCSFETRKDIPPEHTLALFVNKRKKFLESMLNKDYIILLSKELTNKIKHNIEKELGLIDKQLYFYE